MSASKISQTTDPQGLFGHATAALCCRTSAEHWPFKTRQDVLNAINLHLVDNPPSADILTQVIRKSATSINLPEHFTDAMAKAAAYPFAPERPFNILPRETSNFFFDLFTHYKQQLPDKEVGIVEIDISNMGGANDAIGRDNVTNAVAIMNQLYILALENPAALIGKDLGFMRGLELPQDEELNTGNENGNVIAVRKGGDELRYYISGIDGNTINNRLRLADAAVQAFATTLGTDQLEHTKYTHEEVTPDTPISRAQLYKGFGAGSGIVILSNNNATSLAGEVQKSLDDQITAKKLMQGFIKHVHQSYLDIKTAKAIAEETDKNKLKERLSDYRTQLDIEEDIKAPMLPRALVHVSPKPFEDIYEQNLQAAQEAFEGAGEGFGQLFVGVVHNFINLRDPITGLRSSNASIEALNRLKRSYITAGGDKPFILEVELTNLQGLNKSLDHDKADHFIREFANIVRDSVTDELEQSAHDSEAMCYAAGGGKVRILMHDRPMTDMQPVLTCIAKRVEQMNEEMIDGKKIADIEHPKGRVAANGELERGVGISYVGLETCKKWSAGEHFEHIAQLAEKRVHADFGQMQDTTHHVDTMTWMRGSSTMGMDLRVHEGLGTLIDDGEYQGRLEQGYDVAAVLNH